MATDSRILSHVLRSENSPHSPAVLPTHRVRPSTSLTRQSDRSRLSNHSMESSLKCDLLSPAKPHLPRAQRIRTLDSARASPSLASFPMAAHDCTTLRV